MISEHLIVGSIEVMSLEFKGEYHNYELKIKSGVILFTILKLSRCVCDDSVILHKNRAQADPRCIVVDDEVPTLIRQCEH